MANSDFRYHSSYVLTLIITACAGSFYFGYQGGVLAVFKGNFTPVGFPTNSNQASILLSILPLTAALGAALAGPFSKTGRRKALLLTDIIGICGPVIENFPGYTLFLVGRAVCGIAVGLNTALVPLFVNEIAPVKVKGALGTLNQVFVCVGLICGYAVGLGPVSDSDFWWRVMMLVPAGLSALRSFLLLTVFRYETPLFSVKSGNIEEAKKMLSNIYIDDVDNELHVLEEEVRKEAQKGEVTYGELFGSKTRLRFFIGCGLAILQQLSGINAICYQATTILGGSQAASLLVGFGQLAGGLLSTYFIEKYGRKSILLTGTIGCVIFLFLFSGGVLIDINALQLFFLFGYLVSFGISLGPVVWMYIPEIIPAVGVSMTTMTNWIFTALVVQAFSYSLSFGLMVNFIAFGVLCIIGAIMISVYVKETKGKTYAQIEDMYAKTVTGQESLNPLLQNA